VVAEPGKTHSGRPFANASENGTRLSDRWLGSGIESSTCRHRAESAIRGARAGLARLDGGRIVARVNCSTDSVARYRSDRPPDKREQPLREIAHDRAFRVGAAAALKIEVCAPSSAAGERRTDGDHEAGEAAGESHRRPRGARCPRHPAGNEAAGNDDARAVISGARFDQVQHRRKTKHAPRPVAIWISPVSSLPSNTLL